jgi:hypothetical protein
VNNYYFEILLAVHSDFKSDTVILFLLLGGIEQSVTGKTEAYHATVQISVYEYYVVNVVFM